MIVVNPNRIYAYGYPDVNMVPGGDCGCGLTNSRGPFVGLSGLPSSSLTTIALVAAAVYIVNRISKGKKLLPS